MQFAQSFTRSVADQILLNKGPEFVALVLNWSYKSNIVKKKNVQLSV